MSLPGSEIEALLDAKREEELIGVPETDRLDFKASPYLVQQPRGKWELAKDVAALANSGGGTLVIGISTRVPEHREEEIADSITPFPTDLAEVKAYRDILDASSGVYPAVRGLSIKKYLRSNGKALMSITVPEQPPDSLPFLVVRMLEDDAKRGIGVGVPYRDGPHTYWEPPGQLHRDLSDGKRARRESRASATVQTEILNVARVSDFEQLSAAQSAKIEKYMGWGDRALMLLGAVPVTNTTVPVTGFFDPTGIRGAIENPKELRPSGFKLGWRAEAINESGSLINAAAGRQVLWVEPDGTAWAAAPAHPAFLTRTRSGGSVEPHSGKLNPTVLVEWTYLFFHFVHEVLRPAVPGAWVFGVRLEGAQNRPWGIHMGDDDLWEYEAGLNAAVMHRTLGEDPGQAAFEAVAWVYGIFGRPKDAVPYVRDGCVDPDLLREES